MLRIGEVKVIGSCVLSGKRISLQDLTNDLAISDEVLNSVVYASLYGNIVNIVLSGSAREINISSSRYELNIVRESDFRGYLVGVLDSKLEDVALGIIKDARFRDEVIKVLTPWDGEISALIMGRIKITSNYEDFVRVGKCVI